MSAPHVRVFERLAAGGLVRTVDHAEPGRITADITQAKEPLILRGFVSHWPVVKAAAESDQALRSYLARFDRGAVVPISVGKPETDGRVFYNADFSGFNVDHGSSSTAKVFDQILTHGAAPNPPLIYMASVTVDDCLPGFRTDNDVDFGDVDPLASIWVGTKTRIAPHNDLPLNIACVAAGRRRFTLFPPDQIDNLYIGPIEVTPAGRPISLVDIANPDLDRFPRFADAMAAALQADLEPGDAVFIPSMWWHAVEAQDSFNVLVNYWWRTVPAFYGTPDDVLNHAMLSIRGLPDNERESWRTLFDHYVFRGSDESVAHIPRSALGILGPMTSEAARRVRAFLLNRLNR